MVWYKNPQNHDMAPGKVCGVCGEEICQSLSAVFYVSSVLLPAKATQHCCYRRRSLCALDIVLIHHTVRFATSKRSDGWGVSDRRHHGNTGVPPHLRRNTFKSRHQSFRVIRPFWSTAPDRGHRLAHSRSTTRRSPCPGRVTLWQWWGDGRVSPK
jgi:hypothetical protein